MDHQANVAVHRAFLNARSTKKRVLPSVIVIKPSTAELRRWLRDKTTPRHIKNRIYTILRHRRAA